jgi:UDP:flavonoid glycosyltransferase YjiC (YdhE family)
MESNRKKIFIIVLPHSGHINPVASIVHELHATHPELDLIFYGEPLTKALIERTGATYRELSYYDDDKFKSDTIKSKRFSTLFVLAHGLMDMSDHVLPDLIADVEREKPDLIVYEAQALHAKYLLRSLERRYAKKISSVKPPPSIMISTTFAIQLGMYPSKSQLLTMLNVNFWFPIHLFNLTKDQLAFNRKHDMDIYNVLPFLGDQKSALTIATVFPDLQPKLAEFTKMGYYSFAGCCVSENVRKFEVKDEKLKQFIDLFEPVNPIQSVEARPKNGDLKLIYASMGTVADNNIFIFEHLIEAIKTFDQEQSPSLKGSQLRVICSTGAKIYDQFIERIKIDNYQVPDNIVMQPSVPQIDILKRASLFITHCGMNSASETIHYGVPVIAIPLQAVRTSSFFL